MSKITFFSTFFILTFLASELCGNPLLVEDETEEFGRIVNGRNAEEGNTTISEKKKERFHPPICSVQIFVSGLLIAGNKKYNFFLSFLDSLDNIVVLIRSVQNLIFFCLFDRV